jgi:hypothetical protein
VGFSISASDPFVTPDGVFHATGSVAAASSSPAVALENQTPKSTGKLVSIVNGLLGTDTEVAYVTYDGQVVAEGALAHVAVTAKNTSTPGEQLQLAVTTAAGQVLQSNTETDNKSTVNETAWRVVIPGGGNAFGIDYSGATASGNARTWTSGLAISTAGTVTTSGVAEVVLSGNATYAVQVNHTNALVAFFDNDRTTRRGFVGPQGSLMQIVGDSEVYVVAVPTTGIAHLKVGATDEQTRQGTVQTTDATANVVCASWTPNASTTIIVTAYVAARKSDTTTGAGYWRAATFRIASNGTVTQIGTTTAIATNEDIAGYDANIDTSGGLIRVVVTGAASTTLNWRTAVKIIEQAT